MADTGNTPCQGEIIDAQAEISIVQLCRRCAVEAELVQRLVNHGILEPVRVTETTVYFASGSVLRVRKVIRLRSELGVNLAGAALALELLDRIEKLKLASRTGPTIS
jgi:chaperone modulatory protein CbpM